MKVATILLHISSDFQLQEKGKKPSKSLLQTIKSAYYGREKKSGSLII